MVHRPARVISEGTDLSVLDSPIVSAIRRPRPRAQWIVIGLAVAIVAYVALVPVAFLLWRTFFEGGSLSFDAFREAYSAYRLPEMAANSAIFAAASTAIAVAIGTALAYVVVRTDAPWKPLLFGVALVPLAVPGVLYAVAWVFLASPRTGMLNQALEPAFGPGALNIFGMGGMIFVESLRLAPMAFLLMYAGFRSLDPALEESALAAGARPRTVFWRIALPLVRPALITTILITAVRALGAFEIPAVLGIPGGVWVFTSRLWRVATEYPVNLAEAGAYAIPLFVATSVGIAFYVRMTRRARRFETMSGKGYRPRLMPLGRWRVPVIGLVVAYFVGSFLLPVLALVFVSTQPFYTALSGDALSRASFANYSKVFSDATVVTGLKNSFMLSAGVATVAMLLMAICAWLVLRTRLPGRRLLDQLTFVPIAVPGLVLGVSLLFVYLRLPLPIYGTVWILFIAYFTHAVPYGMRYASVSMAQVGRELEESAAVSGAPWLQTFRRVILPLLVPGLLAGWLHIFLISMRELSSSLLLYSPGNEVLPVVLWRWYQDGLFTQVAALGVLTTILFVLVAILARRLSARVGVREM